MTASQPVVGTLTVEDIISGYGRLEILHSVSLSVQPGEAVALFGPNGAGKTTLLKTISGLLQPSSGHIRYGDRCLERIPAYKIRRHGVALVTESLNLFGNLTVEENLELGAFMASDREQRQQDIDHVFEIFPALKLRRRQYANHLSGGERKMLAVGRAVVSRPNILILDEPSLGLSPGMVDTTYHALHRLREEHLTLLIVEQDVKLALDICERGYAMEGGKVILEGPSSRLKQGDVVRRVYLEGASAAESDCGNAK